MTLSAILAGDVGAEVILDGSLGTPGERIGPNYLIPASVGRRQGGNLYHSFSRFNVNQGESATFTSSSPDPVVNVFARVTGGQASTVNGLLRVSIPDANFYLINPAGVLFGVEAELEVSGAFVVTTADVIRFADGATFRSTAVAEPVLSSAVPAAFGFVNTSPGAVRLTANAEQSQGLTAATGKNLSIVAGQIRIEGGRVLSVGGRVNAVSVASAGEVALDPTAFDGDIDVSAFATLGAIELLEGASLRGPAGGRVVVRGGSLRALRAGINADSDVDPGGGIDVQVRAALDLVNGRIASDNFGTAPGGDVRLRADAVNIIGLSSDGVAPVSTNTAQTGDGGDVSIETGSLLITANAAVTSLVQENAPARGGDITVTATREISIDAAGASILTGLAAETLRGSTGASGNITLSAPVVRLSERAEITSTTRGAGSAGVISVTAPREFVIDGRNADTLTGLQARVGRLSGEGATGAGGQIVVDTGTLRIVDAGVISASTFGPGAGGSVTIDADDVHISGTNAQRFTGVFSRTVLPEGGGAGGAVTMTARNIEVAGSGEISAVSTGDGMAGTLEVRASDAVRVRDGGAITVAAGIPDPRPLGPEEPPPSTVRVPSSAGGLTVRAGDGGIEVTNGSVISARATLDSGRIKLDSPGIIRIKQSTITAEAGRSGTPNGLIDIDPTAVVLDRSTINGLAAAEDVPVLIKADVYLASESEIISDTQEVPPEVDVAGALARLATAFAPFGTGLPPACPRVLGNAQISSFVVTARGGNPLSPGGFEPDHRIITTPRR